MKILTPPFLILLSFTFLFYCETESALNLENSPVTSEIILQTTSTWNGTALQYPEGEAKITALRIEIEPGGETGWHHHPVPSFAYILQGTLEVTLESGESERISEGQAVAEVVDTIHNGRNIGDEPVILVVFYTGAVGKDLTVMEE